MASDADDNFERFALDIAEHALLRTVFEDIAELVLPAMDVSYLGCPLALRTFDTYVGGYGYRADFGSAIPIPVRCLTANVGKHPVPGDPAPPAVGGWAFGNVARMIPYFIAVSKLEQSLRKIYRLSNYEPRTCLLWYTGAEDRQVVHMAETGIATISSRAAMVAGGYAINMATGEVLGEVDPRKWHPEGPTAVIDPPPPAGPCWLSSYAVDTPSGEIAAKADVICPWADLSPGSACADWLPFGTVPESFVRLATVAGGGRGLVFEMPGRYDLTTETRGGWIRFAVNSRTMAL